MSLRSIADINFKGKKVFMRVDFNVPLHDGKVTDDYRIIMALPSIKKIIQDGGKLILASHLGRPKGKVVPEMSLKPVADQLSEKLNKKVYFSPDCIGEETRKMADSLKDGDILLLENLRFHKEETDNNPEFARELASLADIYVNDAFGTSHRAHASTVGMTAYFSEKLAGYLLLREWKYLEETLRNPERPFIAILGGAKISGKIDVIRNLLPRVDTILIGGGMAFTFFKAQGKEIGKSLLEEDKLDIASDLLKEAEKSGKQLLLPVDSLAALSLEDRNPRIVSELPVNMMGVDIGPETVKTFGKIIKKSKTVLWNGPMGIFEEPLFSTGTKATAEAIADATDRGAISIIGGGDSAAAIRKFNLQDRVTHVSTGGGASLEMMSGISLPAFEVLSKK